MRWVFYSFAQFCSYDARRESSGHAIYGSTWRHSSDDEPKRVLHLATTGELALEYLLTKRVLLAAVDLPCGDRGPSYVDALLAGWREAAARPDGLRWFSAALLRSSHDVRLRPEYTDDERNYDDSLLSTAW